MDVFKHYNECQSKIIKNNQRGYVETVLANDVTKTINGKTWLLIYSGSKDLKGWKRVALFFKSLALTIVTFGIALIRSPKLCENWSSVFSGRKVRQIFSDPLVNSRTMKLKYPDEVSIVSMVKKSVEVSTVSLVRESVEVSTVTMEKEAVEVSTVSLVRESVEVSTLTMETETVEVNLVKENRLQIKNDLPYPVYARVYKKCPAPKVAQQSVQNSNLLETSKTNPQNEIISAAQEPEEEGTVIAARPNRPAPTESMFSRAAGTAWGAVKNVGTTAVKVAKAAPGAIYNAGAKLATGTKTVIDKKIWIECEACSDLILIPANGSFEIPYSADIKDNRWIYYGNFQNEQEALGYFTNVTKFSRMTNMEYSTAVSDPESKFSTTTLREGKVQILANFRTPGHLPDKNMVARAIEIREEYARTKLPVLDEQNGTPRVVTAHHPKDLELSDKEKEFTQQRNVICQEAMRKVYKTELTADLPSEFERPEMGLVGSGGGLRAMLAFSGFMEGLKEDGLYDAINYISGTSGSTWAMGDLLANDCDPESLSTLPHRISEPLRRGAVRSIHENEAGAAWTRLLSERTKGHEDIEGLNVMHTNWAGRLFVTALGGVPVDPSKEDPRLKPLSQQNVDPKISPLPIFNTIATTRENVFKETITKQREEGSGDEAIVLIKELDFYESIYYHDHLEITHLDSTIIPDIKDRGKADTPACRIPTEAFGRSFIDGKAQAEGAPLQISLLSTISTAGSALTVDFKKIISDSTAARVAVGVAHIFNQRYRIIDEDHPLQVVLEHNEDGPRPNWEEAHTGPIKGLPFHRPVPRRGKTEAIARDAGIDYNVPMIPLVRRGCGIALVCDISGDLNTNPGKELFKAIKDAEGLGLDIPADLTNEVLFNEKVSKAIQNGRLPIVFGDPNNPKELCLVYCPCVKIRANTNDIISNGVANSNHAPLAPQANVVQNEFFTGHWSEFDPMSFSTFKLDYEPIETKMLHSWGKRYEKMVSPKIKEIMCKRIQAMNPKVE